VLAGNGVQALLAGGVGDVDQGAQGICDLAGPDRSGVELGGVFDVPEQVGLMPISNLLWSLLAESGLRLGEALGLQHRDWHTGRGDAPFVEVVPRDHPHGVRVKGSRYRRVFISDELDQQALAARGGRCGAGRGR
jgi:hypothetical protein